MRVVAQPKGQSMFNKKAFLTIGLSALLTACSTANYFSDNLISFERESATQKGVRYLFGRGVVQNDQLAFQYFLSGAKTGDPFAQNEVAFLYAAGRGAERNDQQAFFWYQKAANHGLASAQYNLGLFYERGLGTHRNAALAKLWYQKSAAHGFEPARAALHLQS